MDNMIFSYDLLVNDEYHGTYGTEAEAIETAYLLEETEVWEVVQHTTSTVACSWLDNYGRICN